MHGGDDIGPDIIAIAHEGAEGFFADRLLQHCILRRVGGDRQRAGQGGGVLRHRIAAAGEEGGVHRVDPLEDHGGEGHASGAEDIGEVEFMRGALGHADGGAAQILHPADIGVTAHGKALAVIEIHRELAQADAVAAQKSLGGVAEQHIDLARLQGGEAVLRGERHEAQLGCIAEHGGGDGAAVIGIQAAIFAAAIGGGEAGEALADAADELAAGAHGFQRGGPGGAGPAGQCGCGDDDKALHDDPSLIV